MTNVVTKQRSQSFLTCYTNFHVKMPAGIPFLLECSSSLDSAACSLKLPLVIFLLDRSEQVCNNQKGSALPPQVNGNSGLIGDILETNMVAAVLGPSGQFDAGSTSLKCDA